MTILERYEKTKDNFSVLNNKLWPILEHIEPEERRPVDRLNDTTLILLSIFAFEAFCWDCIRHVVEREQLDRNELGWDLVPALEKVLEMCQVPGKVLSELIGDLRSVMNIRNLYAHGAGRQNGLNNPACLPPKVLIRYKYETDLCMNCTDSCERCVKTDINTEWWPTRSMPEKPGSFSEIGSFFLHARDVIVDGLSCSGV